MTRKTGKSLHFFYYIKIEDHFLPKTLLFTMYVAKPLIVLAEKLLKSVQIFLQKCQSTYIFLYNSQRIIQNAWISKTWY